MHERVLDNAEHWRKRARDTLAKAELAGTADTKARLIRVAKEYEDLARRAEQSRPPAQATEAWLASPIKAP